MARTAPLVLACLVVAVACSRVDRSAYVVANLEILDETGGYPGADRVSIEHSAYSVSDSASRADGYTTLVIYSLAGRVEPEAIIDFYAGALGPDWELSLEEFGCAGGCPDEAEVAIVGNFRNGPQLVSVNLDNLSIGRFEVAIDHERTSGRVAE